MMKILRIAFLNTIVQHKFQMKGLLLLLKAESRLGEIIKNIISRISFIKMKRYIISLIVKKIDMLKVSLEKRKKKATYLKMI